MVSLSQLTARFIVKGCSENPIGQVARNWVAKLMFMPSWIIFGVYDSFNIACRQLGVLSEANMTIEGVGALGFQLGYAEHRVGCKGCWEA